MKNRLIVFLFLAASSLWAAVPPSTHVVVVVLENHGYTSALAGMPYLKSLATANSYALYSYGNTHPSIGNYLMMTTGQIITNSDGYTGTVTANNLARQMLTAGKRWKCYAESLPYVGYIGGDRYPYIKHHVPWAYFSDVRNSSTEAQNIVPFPQFASDLSAARLPQLSFVVPNLLNDAHDGSLATADTWIKNNIGPLLNNSQFKTDGILIVTFDEANSTDTTHGGGHILTVVIGPKVKKGYKATHNYYQQQALLKTIEYALGLPKIGAAATATSFGEMFP